MCAGAAKLADSSRASLRISYLRSYGGAEFHLALEEFSVKYTNVQIKIEYGNHEELYGFLRSDRVDIAFNDQRRSVSDEYVNLFLTTACEHIEISSRSPIAQLPFITLKELKNIPCIIVTSKEQRKNEQEYYRSVVGIQSEFIYAENLKETRMMVIGGQGFMTAEGGSRAGNYGILGRRIPLMRGDAQITRNYYDFLQIYIGFGRRMHTCFLYAAICAVYRRLKVCKNFRNFRGQQML